MNGWYALLFLAVLVSALCMGAYLLRILDERGKP